ncbi:MAG: LAS superfamily LD-carboxypeptidase LdcB [Flavobacteriales bacterium]
MGVILLLLSAYMTISGQDQIFQEYLEQMQRKIEANQ